MNDLFKLLLTKKQITLDEAPNLLSSYLFSLLFWICLFLIASKIVKTIANTTYL